jgi:tetratricopeptide (TPR) repeat protein
MHRPARILAVVLAAASLAAEPARDPLQEARELARQGRLEEAEGALRRAAVERPQDPAPLVELGRLLQQRGDLPGAAESLERALALSADPAPILPLLGQVYLLQNRRPEARSVLERAVAASPGDVGSHYNLGRLLRLEGESAAAARELEAALALRPDEHLRQRIQANLAPLYLDAHRYARAAPLLEDLIHGQPEQAGWRLDLAYAREGVGEPRQALEQAREAARLKPELADAHRLIGSLLRTLGDLQGAIAACQKALALSPREPAALALSATLHLDLGQPDKAQQEARLLIEKNPSHPQAHYLLGQALLAAGDREAAEREFATHRQLAAQRRAFQHTAASLGED